MDAYTLYRFADFLPQHFAIRTGVVENKFYSVLVHDQCSDLELISTESFGSDITWHIPPDQEVDVNTMTRASFGKHAIGCNLRLLCCYINYRERRISNLMRTIQKTYQQAFNC
jgi:hypothetical protein